MATAKPAEPAARPQGAPPSLRDVESLLLDRYPVVAPVLLAALVELMIAGRRESNGDLDTSLVLSLLALRSFQAPAMTELAAEDVLGGTAPALPSLGTNVHSIAASTDISRETVRRKVNQLIEAGLVVRRDGKLMLSPTALPARKQLRAKIVRLAAESHAVVERLLAQTD